MSTFSHTASQLSRLHFVIAMVFEGVKYLHQVALFLVLPSCEYGLIGSVFSLAYLSANLACLEGGNALAPHVATISTNRQRSSYIANRLIIPQLIQHSMAAACVGYLSYQLTTNKLLAITAGSIALSEGVRIALRPLIYTLTKSPLIAKAEATIAFCYIGILWIGAFAEPAFMQGIFILPLYAATSLIGLGYLIHKGLRALDAIRPISTSTGELPGRREIITTQAALLALHLPHNLFSANFIVPFFAYRNGMALAGVIKVASEIASAMRAVIKSSIGFPLNTLFNQLHNGPQKSADRSRAERQEIFATIQAVTTRATTILLVALGVAGAACVMPWPLEQKIIFGGFCILSIADYLCMPYELLSVYSNTVARAAMIRGGEVIVDAVIIATCTQWPLAVVGGIGLVRLIVWKFLSRATRPALFFAGP
ncbi:MAG: hypothetical protein QG604_51 [Candidatus Dependentiae bacterium]|nr:hypothetical protein [Candidatus Dependentiae bacterium]